MADARSNPYLTLKAPGNGDCFYHAVMLDIIDAILTGKIEDESPTGQRIRRILFPEINKQLQQLNGPRFIIEPDDSLKELTIRLLFLSPISALPAYLRDTLPTSINEDSLQEAAITQCDLYHLLRDVCAPALREVMLQGTINHPAYEAEAKKRWHDEFIAYVKHTYAATLGLDKDGRTAARMAMEGGEFYEVPDEIKTPIYGSWQHACKQYGSSHRIRNVEQQLNAVFELWWDTNQQNALHDYSIIHSQPQTQAGKPQQMALSKQLGVNLYLKDRNNPSISPIEETLQKDGTTLLFAYTPMHYDAVVEASPIGEALANQAAILHQDETYYTLNKTHYPWEQVDDVLDVDASTSFEEDSFSSDDEFEDIQDQLVGQAHHSIEKTQRLIRQIENTKPIDLSQVSLPDNYASSLLDAAKKGYDSQNLFKKTKLSQEEQDRLLAIKLQNEEIENFLNPRFKK